MSFITLRRSPSRCGDRFAGKLSSGRRKSAALGSWLMKNGSYCGPRKLACCPGVIDPSLMMYGYDTNVGVPGGDGAKRSTTLPYAGNSSRLSRSR